MPFKRTAGVAGIFFVVLVVAGLLLTAGAPDPDAPSEVIARYYTADAGPAKAASTLMALALIPFSVFVAGLLTEVRPAERDRGEGWSVVGVIGTAVTATAVLVSSGVSGAMAIGAAALRTAPALTGTLYRLNTLMLLGLVALGFALTAGASASQGREPGPCLHLCARSGSSRLCSGSSAGSSPWRRFRARRSGPSASSPFSCSWCGACSWPSAWSARIPRQWGTSRRSPLTRPPLP